MSTFVSPISHNAKIECDRDRNALLCRLEADSSLFHSEHLRERLNALDDLDAGFGDVDSEDPAAGPDARMHQRAKVLRTRLEAANAELYQCMRFDIIRSGRPHALLQWLQRLTSPNESQIPLPGLGFDCRDELLSDVLQLREPSEPNQPSIRPSPEMVFYQPTPVRHILHLIAAAALSEDDIFVDLGAGLGHVPLLVSMVTGAWSVGVELQATYVASAQECAQGLHLSRVRFVPQDARSADLSTGTVFYLYSPFKGSILTNVLRELRMESMRRPIKICSLGPCTRTLANETWLKATAPPDTDRITVFYSA